MSTPEALKQTVSGPPANSASAALTLPALPCTGTHYNRTYQDRVPRVPSAPRSFPEFPFESTRYLRYCIARSVHTPCYTMHRIRSCCIPPRPSLRPLSSLYYTSVPPTFLYSPHPSPPTFLASSCTPGLRMLVPITGSHTRWYFYHLTPRCLHAISCNRISARGWAGRVD